MPRKPPVSSALGDGGGRPLPDVSRYIADLHAAPQPEQVFIGMVKASEDGDTTALSFAYIGDCSNWIKIPEAAIVGIADLPDVVCRGVTYDAARITLTAAISPEGQAYARLADLHRAKLFSTQAALQKFSTASFAPPAAAGCPPGSHQIFDSQGQPHCEPDIQS